MLDPKVLYLVPFINLSGSGRYVFDVLKGRARPNRVTWFLWALAPLIAFTAEIGEGVGIQSILTFMVGFGPLLIFIASFVNQKSVWKITRFDIICGTLSLLGLLLWLITRHGNVAIFFSILADGLAAVPTVVKSYKEPESESSLVFFMASISAMLTLLTIDHWTFANYGFPAYILVICLLLFVLIKFRLGEKISARRNEAAL